MGRDALLHKCGAPGLILGTRDERRELASEDCSLTPHMRCGMYTTHHNDNIINNKPILIFSPCCLSMILSNFK